MGFTKELIREQLDIMKTLETARTSESPEYLKGNEAIKNYPEALRMIELLLEENGW